MDQQAGFHQTVIAPGSADRQGEGFHHHGAHREYQPKSVTVLCRAPFGQKNKSVLGGMITKKATGRGKWQPRPSGAHTRITAIRKQLILGQARAIHFRQRLPVRPVAVGKTARVGDIRLGLRCRGGRIATATTATTSRQQQ